jgi:cytochrome c-type biogenesis protein CcmF
VLVGTLYPLAYEAISGGDKISIGPPYFNMLFNPLMAAIAVFLGIAPTVRWKRTSMRYLLSRLGYVLLASAALGVALPLVLADAVSWEVMLGCGLGAWILGGQLADVVFRARSGLSSLPLSYWGMFMAHLGFAMTLVGVVVTSHMSEAIDVRMAPGDEVQLNEATYRFEAVDQVSGPNYVAQRGRILVTEGGREFNLYPEKRRYLARDSVMTEADIDPGFFRDHYVSLGEPLGGGDWAVRIHNKPLVRWTWFGALLMGLGGVLSVCDKRYRRVRVVATNASRADAAGVADTAADAGVGDPARQPA